jgi:TIGR03009 family protein
MRKFGWSVLGVLAVATGALAQGAVPPPGQDNLDTALRGWEKAMTDLKSFAVVIDRSTHDKALNTKDEFKGHALFIKGATKQAGSRARLELYKANNPKVYEKYVCTGNFLYEYSPSNNKVRIHNMPQNKPGGEQQESFLSFLFGIGADQAKGRYLMEYKGSDKFYHYIRILPKLDQDRGDFAEARLSLYRANHLPAQMWYLQPNRNEITWNFSKLQIDVDIPLTYFQPDFPKDWAVERVDPRTPGNVAPTVRNKGQQ